MKRYNTHVVHNYFSVIDTERKAYFLGLIYADGSVIENKTGRQLQLSLTLQEEDSYLLDEICKDIKPKKIINIANPPQIIENGWNKRAVFKVSSDEICNSLIKLGCPPRKSVEGMYFPDIPKELEHHFIRGFFDGDGCIYLKKSKNKYKRKTDYFIKNSYRDKIYKKISFYSTSLNFLEECLKRFTDLKGKPQWRQRLRTIINYVLLIEHMEDVEEVRKYLYKDATIYMKRKKQKFDMTISSQAIDTSIDGSETT